MTFFPTRAARWKGFRSVLCPIDFSEQSRMALRCAEAIAMRGNGALTVAYANDPLLVASAAVALHDRQLAKQSASELGEFVDSTLSAGSQKRLRVKSDVSTGHPADAIRKAAVRHRSDLVVLGTHGLTGADRLLMGSTTLSVLQRTTIPVLAVPRADRMPAATVSQSWPGQRIVAAIELDAEAGRDADIAARIAQWFGSSLLLLHVVGEISAPAWMRGDLSAHDRIRVAQTQQEIDVLAAAVRRLVETDARVVCGRIADEIAAFAAAERTGLMMTALRDRRAWFGARRGSVSYHVLSHAVTPVLAYPPRWRPR
ncbi:MAG TPA: universal stress protein [Vicinamibacterales bacterium]|nr:universal stress protein [Vicinamibacterales bacterium]